MPRYIDTEKIRLYKGFFEKIDNVPKFYEWLETLPTADVVERKVGKWKLNKDGNWSCPFCEFDPYHDNMKGMNYCPNCGAKLERREYESGDVKEE